MELSRLKAIAAPVRKTLECVIRLHETSYGIYSIYNVYVYGREAYDKVNKSNGGTCSQLNYKNWLHKNGDLYVLNEILFPHDNYGPYNLIFELLQMARIPQLKIYKIVYILDNYYHTLETLDQRYMYKLQDEDFYPKKLYSIPESIKNEARHVQKNYQAELETCMGVIFIPFMIDHDDWQHKRVRISQRNDDIITIFEERYECKAHFLLKTCSQQFYDDPDNPVWYLIHKNHLPLL